ncbi:hypothetical protein [Allosphingosinicella vermicomposti]|uniref:hypothetical protein n=1 Tax=Allosphingosinicella vermicomposti TaxID=614671 RepID=UPI00131A5606|nr:hypothetical protein [Allosphingosinicella vermicomposti]
MRVIRAKNVKINGNIILISTLFCRFYISRREIESVEVKGISSLFDEIGILIKSKKIFLVTERASGFFDLAEFLRFEDIFGYFWYRDAEDGKALSCAVRPNAPYGDE